VLPVWGGILNYGYPKAYHWRKLVKSYAWPFNSKPKVKGGHRGQAEASAGLQSQENLGKFFKELRPQPTNQWKDGTASPDRCAKKTEASAGGLSSLGTDSNSVPFYNLPGGRRRE